MGKAHRRSKTKGPPSLGGMKEVEVYSTSFRSNWSEKVGLRCRRFYKTTATCLRETQVLKLPTSKVPSAKLNQNRGGAEASRPLLRRSWNGNIINVLRDEALFRVTKFWRYITRAWGFPATGSCIWHWSAPLIQWVPGWNQFVVEEVDARRDLGMQLQKNLIEQWSIARCFHKVFVWIGTLKGRHGCYQPQFFYGQKTNAMIFWGSRIWGKEILVFWRIWDADEFSQAGAFR